MDLFTSIDHNLQTLYDIIQFVKLWKNLSDAVVMQDMHAATQEKFILEERQRNEAKERKAQMLDWVPKLFERDPITSDWIYKHVDMRPWDNTNDKLQYESNFIVTTWTKHRTPVVRTLSITSLEQKPDKSSTSVPVTRASSRQIQRPSMKKLKVVGEESGSSTAELDQKHDSDSSEPGIRKRVTRSASNTRSKTTEDSLTKVLEPVLALQQETNSLVQSLQRQAMLMQQNIDNQAANQLAQQSQTWIILAVAILVQTILQWFLR